MSDYTDLKRKAEAVPFRDFSTEPRDPTMGGATWQLRERGVPGIRASVVEYQHGPELREYIEAADPATVILLIERCEAAEMAVAKAREVLKRYVDEYKDPDYRGTEFADGIIEASKKALKALGGRAS